MYVAYPEVGKYDKIWGQHYKMLNHTKQIQSRSYTILGKCILDGSWEIFTQ